MSYMSELDIELRNLHGTIGPASELVAECRRLRMNVLDDEPNHKIVGISCDLVGHIYGDESRAGFLADAGHELWCFNCRNIVDPENDRVGCGCHCPECGATL